LGLFAILVSVCAIVASGATLYRVLSSKLGPSAQWTDSLFQAVEVAAVFVVAAIALTELCYMVLILWELRAQQADNYLEEELVSLMDVDESSDRMAARFRNNPELLRASLHSIGVAVDDETLTSILRQNSHRRELDQS
jgi:hypothetical protein